MGTGTKNKRPCKYLTTMKTSTWLCDGVFTSAGKIKTELLNTEHGVLLVSWLKQNIGNIRKNTISQCGVPI